MHCKDIKPPPLDFFSSPELTHKKRRGKAVVILMNLFFDKLVFEWIY